MPISVGGIRVAWDAEDKSKLLLRLWVHCAVPLQEWCKERSFQFEDIKPKLMKAKPPALALFYESRKSAGPKGMREVSDKDNFYVFFILGSVGIRIRSSDLKAQAYHWLAGWTWHLCAFLSSSVKLDRLYLTRYSWGETVYACSPAHWLTHCSNGFWVLLIMCWASFSEVRLWG